MALPTAGWITMADIKAEFGGPDYRLGTYYRGGVYVPAHNTNVPTSGPISMTHFLGASKVPPSTPRG